MCKFIKKIIEKDSNESSKRAIAIMFSVTLVVIYFFTKSDNLREILISCYVGLIALLLGLATIETIIQLVRRDK